MVSMTAFADELVKISQGIAGVVRNVLPAAAARKKELGLLALGAGGFAGAQRLGQDIAFAERLRAQGHDIR